MGFYQAQKIEKLESRIAELEAYEKYLTEVNADVYADGVARGEAKSAARIAVLEAALKPFAENFGLDRKVYRHEGVTMTLVDDDILQRCCEAARAAMEGKDAQQP